MSRWLGKCTPEAELAAIAARWGNESRKTLNDVNPSYLAISKATRPRVHDRTSYMYMVDAHPERWGACAPGLGLTNISCSLLITVVQVPGTGEGLAASLA